MGSDLDQLARDAASITSTTPRVNSIDPWLARLVAGGLILVALGGLLGGAVLRARGLEAGEIAGLGSTAVGALAGFLAGVGIGRE